MTFNQAWMVVMHVVYISMLCAAMIFGLPTLKAAEPVNLDRLADAVAVAETGGCTKGMALTRNNCHGIMTWARGYREGKRFKRQIESFRAFKRLWRRKYQGIFPTIVEATRYTGGDNPEGWLKVVNKVYDVPASPPPPL